MQSIVHVGTRILVYLSKNIVELTTCLCWTLEKIIKREEFVSKHFYFS